MQISNHATARTLEGCHLSVDYTHSSVCRLHSRTIMCSVSKPRICFCSSIFTASFQKQNCDSDSVLKSIAAYSPTTVQYDALACCYYLERVLGYPPSRRSYVIRVVSPRLKCNVAHNCCMSKTCITPVNLSNLIAGSRFGADIMSALQV
jgi:hypothetical protein